jgi:ribose-phosphate pyrophosphokinase
MKKPLFVLIAFLGSIVFEQMLFSHDISSVEWPAGCCFNENAVLFSGNANLPLAENVAKYLGVNLGRIQVKKFTDGEIQIQIEQNVRNKQVFVLQPTSFSLTESVNDNMMELYLLVRALRRASAASITAVVPYYGYARQDRKTSPRVPISAADIALLLETAGIDRMVTVDLHCGQIQGFFRDIPVDNLYALNIFVPYFTKKELENVVVVSPDAGGVERAKKFAESLTKHGVPARLAVINKQRAKAEVIESMNLMGEVEDADVIIVDDLCSTAGTLVQASVLLKEKGARRVFAAVTHPVFAEVAYEKIRSSAIDEMLIADTIPLKQALPPNVKSLSVAPLLGEAIRRIYLGESVSELFQ